MAPQLDASPDWRAHFVTELPAAVALFDRDGRYVAASAAWIAAFDLSRVAVTGRRHDELHKSGDEALAEVQRRALSGEVVEYHESAERTPGRKPRRQVFSARPHRDLDGGIAGVLVAMHEVRLPHDFEASQPAPDPLTGLPSRDGFTQRLREIFADSDPQRRSVALLAINLDSFRSINNLHGIRIGDQVLKITAERLASGTRSRPGPNEPGTGGPGGGDMVARLGDDEFGVICGTPTPTLAEIEGFCARLLRIVQTLIVVGDLRIRMTASIGFVLTGSGMRDENEALRDLDLALREAKALGPNKAMGWHPALTRTATQKYSLADQLRRAFDNREFVLHYQPIVRLSDNRMVGAETLLRWNHPSDGLVAPGAFLPVLEETGLIVPVGCWVIRETVRQMQSWKVLYGRDILDWISVNVSARQFNDPGPLLAAFREIHDSGFPLHRVRVEITETTFMRNSETTRRVLEDLHGFGIRIAIDDFGTGYSALGTLRHYPVDTIKIDTGFVAQIGTPDGEKLAQALLNIARMYGASVIAEGVETAAQRDFLRDVGCDFAQGHFFAKPMDAALLGTFALTRLGGDQPDGSVGRLTG
jgi:diguanylate cyclase (GGDEF)-like protein/PAS domain S-box-containing protein